MPKKKYWRKSVAKQQSSGRRLAMTDDNTGLDGSSKAKHPSHCNIPSSSNVQFDSVQLNNNSKNIQPHNTNPYSNNPYDNNDSHSNICNICDNQCYHNNVPQQSHIFSDQASISKSIEYHLLQSNGNVNLSSDCENLQWKSYTISHVVQASIHQGSSVFHEPSRGNQCTCNALVYLCVSHERHSLTSEDLDNILHEGDNLYRQTVNYLQANNKLYSEILMFDELPNVVDMKSLHYNIEKRKQYFGLLDHITDFDVTGCLQFKDAVTEAFKSSNTLLLMTGGYSMALSKHHSGKYCVFDSHSRDQNGFQHINGSSILLFFNTQHALINYLFSLFNNLNLNKMTQYEIQEVVIQYVKHPSYQTQQQHNRDDELLVNYFNFQSQQQASIQKVQKTVNCDHNVRSTSIPTAPKKVTRKVYAREYKQKQREHHAFLIHEREMDKSRKAFKRQNAEFRAKEKVKQQSYKKERRQIRAYRELEKVKLQSHIKELRQNPDYKKNEKCKQQIQKTVLRQNPKFREIEKQKVKLHLRELRQNPDFKQKEKCKQQMQKKIMRQNPKFRETEKQKVKLHLRELRQIPEFKQKEKCKQQMQKKILRQNPKFRETEKQKVKLHLRELRQIPEFKQKEKCKQQMQKKILRQNPKFRETEKQKVKLHLRELRQIPEFKQKEKCKQQMQKKILRQNPKFRKTELHKVKLHLRELRQIPDFKQTEKERLKVHIRNLRTQSQFRLREKMKMQMHIKSLRKDPNFRNAEKRQQQAYRKSQRQNVRLTDTSTCNNTQMLANNQRQLTTNTQILNQLQAHQTEYQYNHEQSLQDCIDSFQKTTSKGPIYVCSSCHQTWFRKSVTQAERLTKYSTTASKCLTGYISVNNIEWVCNTCYSSISVGKIPKLSKANNMNFPDIPPQLHLHQLEERLIALRIPFMRLYNLPRGGQRSLSGPVVNIPTDITPTVNMLPRMLSDSATIPVKLKRKLSYTRSEFTENIRPNKVMNALKWLMQHSVLYQNSGIHIDDSWFQKIDNNPDPEMTALIENTDSASQSPVTCESESESDADTFSEVDTTEGAVANMDTLLDETNSNQVFTIAPGENQKPLSLFADKDAEYLAFPTLFCGQRRTIDTEYSNVYYSDICKWEVRNVDRRVANSVPNLFFKLKKLQLKQISDKVHLALRRCKTEGKCYKVADLLNPEKVTELLRLDDGFYIFRDLRNSPPYLEKRKKDVFAMIRQLGLPTWFTSLSSADTKWIDLHRILGVLVDGKHYTDDDLKAMDWATKTRLLQSDPVTCARFFDHRINEFINTVLKSPHEPIGKLTDYFYRVEFQQRGSPHIHMLMWIENAPNYQQNTPEEVTTFIDKYISCSSDVPPEISDLVNLQTHKHSKTCREKGKPICRFGYPMPPMSETMILTPLDDDNTVDISKYKELYEDIKKRLDDMKEGKSVSFAVFLATELHINHEDYIMAIRSSLKATTIFLKREPCDLRVNAYMKSLLPAWGANHDLQFVLDPYACAMYIVSYISKSQRGMSALLDQACKEARRGNMELKAQVRHIGNKFLNNVEISAQEAAYIILQMPLTKATRQVVFINTSPPDERTFLLKSKTTLENMPADSTNIESDSLIKRYARRPKVLENWCLADYASKVKMTYPKDDKFQSSDVNGNNPDFSNDSDSDTVLTNITPDDSKINITLRNGTKIQERHNPCIIRYVHYNKKVDHENFCREKLLLYMPWRNEITDLLNGCDTFQQSYELNKQIIAKHAANYEHYTEELEHAKAAAEQCDINDTDAFDHLAPNTQQTERDDLETGPTPSDHYAYFDPDKPEHATYDIGFDVGLRTTDTTNNDNNTLPGRVPDDQYHALVRSLNLKQKEIFHHVLKSIKTNKDPLRIFITGGAGSGKSVVIKAIYQALHRFLCSTAGEDPSDCRLLLCAPTGKAAYNINGSTIHSAFKVPASQGYKYKPLDSDKLNTLQAKYQNLSVVIIDEISMVGNQLFNFINLRLQQIKGNNQPFGGVSMITVGDLFQLKPVMDGWIFKDLTTNYGPLATNLWKEYFTMHELTEIMRQKDDLHFAQLLNRLREGNHTEQDITELEQHVIHQTNQPNNKCTPYLYMTNHKVIEHNNEVFRNTSTCKVKIPAMDTIIGDVSQKIKDNILKTIPTDSSKTCGLLSEACIAIGLRYDITANIDVEDGMTNGAGCIVQQIDFRMTNTSSNRPSIIWVKFDDENIGHFRRHKYRHLYHTTINKQWTPIFDIKRQFPQSRYNKHVSVMRIQFPLTPSAAKTIHKSQGSTMDEVVINMAGNKTDHIHYVAISRVTTLNGLHIVDLNKSKISISEAVRNEMFRLRQHIKLHLCFTPLYELPNDHCKIVFLNARSLHKHFADLQSEQNLLAADIIGIAESRLTTCDTNETYSLPNYNIYRNDQITDQNATHVIRPYHGLVLYLRQTYELLNIKYHTTTAVEFIYADLLTSLRQQIQLVILYKSPRCSLQTFQEQLTQYLLPNLNLSMPLIIMGDFNLDILSGNIALLNFVINTCSCHQLITEETTDNHTALDLIFINRPIISSGTLEISWSDHKAIYIVI
ncbi:uncharacterized protein [Ptychodera flava]|uniref:uncharacterized protein n=1 Tax=Ptychodera flava TaxID=63121 RepID=UPI00396A8784